MAPTTVKVYGGVDTHGRTHHAAALDSVGRLLGDAEFPASSAGYQQLINWLATFGTIIKVGVEGTGSWGRARRSTARRGIHLSQGHVASAFSAQPSDAVPR